MDPLDLLLMLLLGAAAGVSMALIDWLHSIGEKIGGGF